MDRADLSPLTLAVGGAGSVSALLLRPAHARAAYVFAHGAGAGMHHPFMAQLAEALGALLEVPPPLDLRHVRRPAVSVEQRLRHLRDLLARRSRFSFDEAVEGADRLTEAVTLFALLELYKAGEAKWEQEVPFGPITVVPAS